MNCEFCNRDKSPLRIPISEGVDTNVYVCDNCWKLLQNPATALPLLRGDLTLKLRKTVPEDKLNKMINSFMGEVSKWHPITKN